LKWKVSFGELFGLNLRFVNEHYWDIVLNRIDAMALTTFKSLAVRRQFHGRFAQWTNKNVQQFLTDCHDQKLRVPNVELNVTNRIPKFNRGENDSAIPGPAKE
jgi:hypothetical protein